MTELGAGIDELEADLLQGPLLGVGEEGLSRGEDTLLAASLQQDEFFRPSWRLRLPFCRSSC